MGTEVLSQAITSIEPFKDPSINLLNFAGKRLIHVFFALLTPSGRGFSNSDGRGLPL